MERNEYSSPFEKSDNRISKRRTVELVLRVYSLIGLLAAILGAGYLAETLLPFELSASQKIAVGIVSLGLVFAILSRALIVFYREREAAEVADLSEQERLLQLLDTWSKFEAVSRAVLDQQGEKFDQHSIRSIISKLRSDEKIDDLDVEKIEKALEVRNAIVHGQRSLPSSFVQAITETLVNVIQKMIIQYKDTARL